MVYRKNEMRISSKQKAHFVKTKSAFRFHKVKPLIETTLHPITESHHTVESQCVDSPISKTDSKYHPF